jgi:hypothetical protein
MLKVPAEIIDAIRAGKLDGSSKLIVLAATVREIVNKHCPHRKAGLFHSN